MGGGGRGADGYRTAVPNVARIVRTEHAWSAGNFAADRQAVQHCSTPSPTSPASATAGCSRLAWTVTGPARPASAGSSTSAPRCPPRTACTRRRTDRAGRAGGYVDNDPVAARMARRCSVRRPGIGEVLGACGRLKILRASGRARSAAIPPGRWACRSPGPARRAGGEKLARSSPGTRYLGRAASWPSRTALARRSPRSELDGQVNAWRQGTGTASAQMARTAGREIDRVPRRRRGRRAGRRLDGPAAAGPRVPGRPGRIPARRRRPKPAPYPSHPSTLDGEVRRATSRPASSRRRPRPPPVPEAHARASRHPDDGQGADPGRARDRCHSATGARTSASFVAKYDGGPGGGRGGDGSVMMTAASARVRERR